MRDDEIRNGLIKYNAHAARWTKENSKHLATPFPRGIIRPLTDLRSRWPYLSRADARTVSCAIQLCDVNRFYMHTYSVGLTAGTMWEWHVTLPVIAVIETLCGKVIAKEGWGLGKNFSNCIKKLHEKQIINARLKARIEAQQAYRDEVHLYLKDKIEMHDGTPLKYNRAVKVLHKLEKALIKYYEPGK